MKKLIIIASCVIAGATAWGQGQVNFSNGAAAVNAPVTNNAGGARITGPAYSAQLYFAAPGTTAFSSYTPVAGPVAFATGASAGYFFGGPKTIPGFANGASVSLIVAAFDSASYSTALSRGFSAPVLVTLTTSPTPPPNMVGLQSFGVSPIPEPSTIALGALGAAALLLRRRK